MTLKPSSHEIKTFVYSNQRDLCSLSKLLTINSYLQPNLPNLNLFETLFAHNPNNHGLFVDRYDESLDSKFTTIGQAGTTGQLPVYTITWIATPCYREDRKLSILCRKRLTLSVQNFL